MPSRESTHGARHKQQEYEKCDSFHKSAHGSDEKRTLQLRLDTKINIIFFLLHHQEPQNCEMSMKKKVYELSKM